MQDLNTIGAQVIKDVRYMTLSTVTPEGLPWGSPVSASYDE